MDNDKDFETDQAEREAQALRQIRVGIYLNQLRSARKLKLTDIAEATRVSASYLSDIERGKKLPSDLTIRALAKFYEVDEIDMFARFGKTPLDITLALLENPSLKRTIRDVSSTKKLTDDEKQEFFDKVERLYRDFVIEKNPDNSKIKDK